MKLLIADDEKNIRQVLKIELASDGIVTEEAENGRRALELLEKGEYDVLLLDLNMPVMGGIEVLKQMKAHDIPTEVVVLTANATVATAVEAMKLGAYDYLTKPFRLDELAPVIEKAFEKKRLRNENMLLKTQLERQSRHPDMVAASAVMRDLLDTVARVAQSSFPVLITGESGSGKELVAASVHHGSGRADGPFVPINCGALPETMFESELFGFEKGAFTGAVSRKPGLLEVASGGTLFLDEIGDMPAALQVKLLRVIETGRFYRLGGTRELTVDVRIIAATNKDLKAQAAAGAFRQDLFYRISAFTVFVPPLRQRTDDIPALIEAFVRRNPAFRKKRFGADAVRMLSAYSWPGNVRELQNVVNRAMLLSRSDVIGPEDLPGDLGEDGTEAGMRLADVEREHILRTLRTMDGHRGRAAEALGIDPKTLYRKLTSYGIGPE